MKAYTAAPCRLYHYIMHLYGVTFYKVLLNPETERLLRLRSGIRSRSSCSVVRMTMTNYDNYYYYYFCCYYYYYSVWCTLLCSNCKKIGAQTMLIAAIVVTEVLITFKFDWQTFTKPLPRHVVVGWMIGLAVLAIWTIWHFYLQRLLTHTEVRSAAADQELSNGAAADGELNGGVRRRKAHRADAR